MASVKDIVASADWKTEKHVPVIECAAAIGKGQVLDIAVCVGKEIAHPNTTEHHIAWIEVYFLPTGEKFAYQIGKCEFSAHGAAVPGPNTSTVYTLPAGLFRLKTEKPGTLIATGYCNIHGVWESQREITVA